MSRAQPLLAFVGGFLGAGKTTLILKAARLLQDQGKRVAIITNDQDAGLVDTERARALRYDTREVSGGCFCCRFSQLIDAAEELVSLEPDVIFAEPVGSCIDLSATILQPLKAFHRETYRLAPLSVLIDPVTANEIAHGRVAPEVEYLFQGQLAEADLACVTKRDLHPALPDLALPIDFHLSARTGEGVEGWLKELQASSRVVGAKLLEVDYQQYGRAEAALGWLNLHARIRLEEPASPAGLCGPLLDRLEASLTSAGIEITHLKIFDRALTGWVSASISHGQPPAPEGDLLADAARDHEVAINLRAVADPAQLRLLTETDLKETRGEIHVQHLGAFRPAQPEPEHRFAYTVGTR